MKVALVCIAKDEDSYIKEWVEYHIKLGFDDIFMYQNNYRSSYEHKNLIKINFDTTDGNRQLQAYNDFIRKNTNKYDFAAFFDVDEFLVLKKHNDVKSFVSEYVDFLAIGINWVFFGDNGLKKVENNNYSCLKRFTKRQNGVFSLIKSIVKVDSSILMGAHSPYCEWVCPKKKPHTGNLNEEGDDSIAQLNHYFSKTFEEYELKMSKGKVCNNYRPVRDFYDFNFNDMDDFTAYNFFYK